MSGNINILIMETQDDGRKKQKEIAEANFKGWFEDCLVIIKTAVDISLAF